MRSGARRRSPRARRRRADPAQPDPVVVGEHAGLREAGGARGVLQVRQRSRPRSPPAERSCGKDSEPSSATSMTRTVHERRPRRTRTSGDESGALGVGEQHPGSRVAQHEGEVGALVGAVDRYGDRAGLENGEPDDRPVHDVGQHDRDPVVRLGRRRPRSAGAPGGRSRRRSPRSVQDHSPKRRNSRSPASCARRASSPVRVGTAGSSPICSAGTTGWLVTSGRHCGAPLLQQSGRLADDPGQRRVGALHPLGMPLDTEDRVPRAARSPRRRRRWSGRSRRRPMPQRSTAWWCQELVIASPPKRPAAIEPGSKETRWSTVPSVGATSGDRWLTGSAAKVRDEGAAEGDVEHLQAAAHAEHRDAPVECGPDDGHLVLVALEVVDHRVGPRVDVADDRGVAAPAGRVHVLATGDDDTREPVADVCRVGVVGQVHRQPAGLGDPRREVRHGGVDAPVAVPLVGIPRSGRAGSGAR